MMKKFIKLSVIIALLAAGGIALHTYFNSGQNAEAADATSQGAPQAMPVDIAIIKSENVKLWKNYSGNIVAVDQAEIRPQVSGKITEVRFEDGQDVEKGDTLIVIDPRPYKARVSQAKAALEAAQTQISLAEKEYQRAAKLINSDAISQSVLDERTNALQTRAADILAARAALESAQIDLDYAYIKAPISGKVSRAEITEGNIVEAGPNAPLLTTVVSTQKVYVDFEVDERTYINAKKSGIQSASEIPVRLKLVNTDHEYSGQIQSFDNRIDQSSGTIRARAVFDNEDGTLLPGMTVSVLMGEADDSRKILVSERAIGTDQDRKFVYTVNGDKVAKYQEVKIGQSVNGHRVILSGLEPGEKIITSGLVRIRPGMPVEPKQTASNNTLEPPPMDNEVSVTPLDETDIDGEE